MNLIDVAKQFGTPEACNDFLESMRWPEGITCLACESKRVSKYVKQAGTRTRVSAKTGKAELKPVPARILYVCLECGKQFSVTEGTIFNDTHLSLDKWYTAVALMVNAKKGLSAMQVKRDLGCAYKTAWYLSHRIRKAMGLIEAAEQEPFSGTVEVDEAYMGSKRYDKRRKRGKYEKAPVFGMVERDGKARTWHIPHVSSYNVKDKLRDNISIDASAVYTDDSRMYDTMPGNIKTKHEKVNHSKKEWVRGDVHTGTIDGYWGLLKRGIIGSFHQVSVKHLHRYLSEFQFRWNNRKAQDIFILIIAALVIGSALPYKELIASIDEETNAGPEVELDGEAF
jgi:DNA-directed RNA polymerase subunit RPC12/RpoP/transposase-like protein